MHRPLAALALTLVAAAPAAAETVAVTLKGGGHLEGQVLRESDAELVLRIDHGTLRLQKRDVQTLERKPDAPRPPAPPSQRIPGWNRVLQVMLAQPGADDLRQVPATVIDEGVLASVPYVSHRFGAFELNVYGDPDHPAGYEVGVVRGAEATAERKRACVALVRELLTDDADRAALDALSLEPGRRTAHGLTVEVTPPEAPDSDGGWWVSVYDPAGLARARASQAELEQITIESGARDDDPAGWTADDYARARRQRQAAARATPTAPPTVTAPPPPAPAVQRRVFRRGFYREDGTFVRRRRIRR